MVTKKKVKNTVKIDENLLERVRKLFEDEDMRIEYPTLKSFVNIAVLKLLKKKEAEKNE